MSPSVKGLTKSQIAESHYHIYFHPGITYGIAFHVCQVLWYFITSSTDDTTDF